MIISVIVAKALNGVIGIEGRLPWERQLPRDKLHFMEVTAGKPVIMGRLTYESIPAKFRPLAGRTNIILSRDPNYQPNGCIVRPSLHEALLYARVRDPIEVFVAGGAGVYAEALVNTDRVYMTLVLNEFEGDTYFPALSEDHWEPIDSSAIFPSDQDNGFACQFTTYRRKRGQ